MRWIILVSSLGLILAGAIDCQSNIETITALRRPRESKTEYRGLKDFAVDYWGGYYDFLINEGSYKFWAIFQLATAALLIYSGFAALYYAKVNPPTTTDDDFDDIFRRRRRRKRLVKNQWYRGIDDMTFQRIIDAIERQNDHR